MYKYSGEPNVPPPTSVMLGESLDSLPNRPIRSFVPSGLIPDEINKPISTLCIQSTDDKEGQTLPKIMNSGVNAELIRG